MSLSAATTAPLAAANIKFASIVVVVVVVVFTLNRSFYPTTAAVHPVSVLIFYPREIQILWSQTVRQKKQKSLESRHVDQSIANAPGTRAPQTRQPRNNNCRTF